MPNMFGGDQFHPAYMPQELSPNEILVGNVVYRLIGDQVEEEHVSGEKRRYRESFSGLPDEVKKKFDL